MDFFNSLIERNAEYAANEFSADLKIIPSEKTLILGCVDPRVDPLDILKLKAGEAAIIRNVGGRVNPALLETMNILRTVSKAGGSEIGAGWNFVVLQHTKCGIVGCMRHDPALLAKQMGVEQDKLSDLAIADPYEAVKLDVAALKANPDFADDLVISGLVYDVDTGRVEAVVPPAPIRTKD